MPGQISARKSSHSVCLARVASLENRPHRTSGVLSTRLPGLEIHVDAAVVAVFVQQILQHQQDRCLASLTVRMQHEMFFILDGLGNMA